MTVVGVPPAERAVAMHTLLLDAVAARSIGVLARHGVPAVLLKGRVTASWLYADSVRRYGDVDLLVDPAQRDRAVEVLGAAGYRHWLAGASAVEYGTNELELVGPNGVCIDLHHTLLGVAAEPARCWAVLSARTERMVVGGREVPVLDPPARAMHLALHVAQNGPADVKAVADLERGLDQLPAGLWAAALALAVAVDGLPAFAAGLRAVPAGRPVADRLGLGSPRSIELVLRGWSAPTEALQVQRFLEAGTWRRRLSFLGRKFWPTRAYMFGHHPTSRAGARLLLTARLRRLRTLPTKAGRALWNWNRARRAVRALAPTDVTPATGKGLP